MHGVSGEVFAVDARTIFIKNFSYDGEGPGTNYFRLTWSLIENLELTFWLIVHVSNSRLFLRGNHPAAQQQRSHSSAR